MKSNKPKQDAICPICDRKFNSNQGYKCSNGQVACLESHKEQVEKLIKSFESDFG